MSKISRNTPCPCGSGKKYKKCCLSKDEQVSRNMQNTDLNEPEQSLMEEYIDFYNDGAALDDLSNSVIDMINAGRLDEAEDTCKELHRRYPDDVDWLERSAMVYEAKGNKEKAIEFYEKTIEFGRTHPGFDPEFFTWTAKRIEKIRMNKKDGWTLNFECKNCKKEFDCEVGQIAINEKTMRPVFEKPIICPQCGERSIDDVFLTELGQGQMTEATWNL